MKRDAINKKIQKVTFFSVHYTVQLKSIISGKNNAVIYYIRISYNKDTFNLLKVKEYTVEWKENKVM